jgi:hypothetical protein
MCMMCDGATREEIIEKYSGLIDEHGWMAVALPPSARSPGWAYTVGLTARFAHPELVVLTCSAAVAHRRLAELVERIAGGDRVVPGELAQPVAEPLELRSVADSQLNAGLMAMWPDVAARRRWPASSLRAVQVLDPTLTCTNHDRIDWDLSLSLPLLSRPGSRVPGDHQTGRRRAPKRPTRARRPSGDPRKHPRRAS